MSKIETNKQTNENVTNIGNTSLQKSIPGSFKEPKRNDTILMYNNASELIITDEEQVKLQEPIDDDDIEIRPDGLIYCPQVFVRDRLNKSLGIGQWALIQHKIIKDSETNYIFFDGSLFIRGKFVARAMGEQKFHFNNPMQSWASAYESAKSDCLVRCCKDLGIAKELWQPKFTREWIKKYAVKVYVQDKKTLKIKTSWRRKDQDPFWNETGIVKTQQKSTQVKSRNFTEEAAQCKTIEELKKWWDSLTPQEHILAVGVKKERKEELSEREPAKEEPAKDKLIDRIRKVKTIEEIKNLESEVDKIEDTDKKLLHINALKKQIIDNKLDYQLDILPF